MRHLALTFMLLTGCTLYGDDPDDDPVDGWAGADLPSCTTTRTAYRIDRITLPLNSSEAEELGVDLDGDGTVDNQGGNLMSAVIQAVDVDLQGAVDEALAADLVQIGVVIDECRDPAYALVSLVRGVELDRSFDPPRMIGEDVTVFPAAATIGLSEPAIDGTAQFPAGQLLHPIADRWIGADQLVATIDATAEDGIAGTLAAALDGDQTFDEISLAFQAKLADKIAELGPCTEASCDPVLRTLLDGFDRNADGEVTLAEVRESSLTMTLLRADVDTNADGEEDSFSVGIGFHAERVELELP